MRRHVGHSRQGDTLIEVMFAISIFAFIAILTINMMNDGLNTAQRTLEAEMARNEIDAQAEALRYIHNNYVAERQKLEGESQFRKIWSKLISNAVRPSLTVQEMGENEEGKSFDINNMDTCEDPYKPQGHMERYKAFILNTRLIVPELSPGNDFTYLGYGYNKKLAGKDSSLLDHIIEYYNQGGMKSDKFSAPSLYPRLLFKKLGTGISGTTNDVNEIGLDESSDVYNDVYKAEGVWINAVSNIETLGGVVDPKRGADYYDFYIRTCWHAAGKRAPSTITTVVRLYNPEVME